MKAYSKFLTLALLMFSCMSCSYAKKNDCVNDLRVILLNKDNYSDRDVSIVGCIMHMESRAVHFFPCDNFGETRAGNYVDLVGAGVEEEMVGKRGEVCIYGRFRAYSRGFVGIGNLTSEIGLIEVKEIVVK